MPSFILTWNPQRFEMDPARLAKAERDAAKGRSVVDRWSMGNTKHQAMVGDRVFLLRQESDRGIVASGRLTSPVFQEPAFDDPTRQANYGMFEFDAWLPVDERLPMAELVAAVPGFHWRTLPASGMPLPEPHASLVAEAWRMHLEQLGRTVASKPSNPKDVLPDWKRDELILAVDLYLRKGEQLPAKTDADVLALSETLRSLPIHLPRPKNPKFRNPAGVYRKLADIHTASPSYSGKQTRGNKLDGIVLAEFKADPSGHAELVRAIRGLVDDPDSARLPRDVDDLDDAVDEGGILERRHFRRERDPKKVRDKKAKVFRETGSLRCEVCDFDFADTYGGLGDGFIECHHRRPLAESGPTKTRLADLALVCSNCHRMIHRRRPWLSVEELAALVRGHHSLGL